MIEKILNEISRLKKELDGYSALEALDYIESYINIISREPASDDLEKEIDKEIDDLCDLGCYMEDLAKGNSEGVYPLPDNVVKELRKFARHFIEWQEKKMLGIAEAFYQQGRYEQEQEMMKDAVYGYVSLCHDYPYRRSLVAIADGLINFEYAEKVKIIIVKEE
jgi:hypothetical protein